MRGITYPPSTISSRHRRIISKFSSASLWSTLFLKHGSEGENPLSRQSLQKCKAISNALRDEPKEQGDCIEESLQNGGQDQLIFFIAPGHKEVQILDKLINDYVVLYHCYLRCTNKRVGESRPQPLLVERVKKRRKNETYLLFEHWFFESLRKQIFRKQAQHYLQAIHLSNT